MKVFAQQGVDAQMTDIASAAGVGVATLYRNFETKQALVDALVLDRLERSVVASREVVEDSDPERALIRFLQSTLNLQMESRVLADFIGGRIVGGEKVNELRDELHALTERIVERAKAAGAIRSDINVSDIRMVNFALSRVAVDDSPSMARMSRRLLGIFLDGLREQGTALEGPPLTIDEWIAATLPSGPDPAPAFRRGRRAWHTT
jgi:AcrR family transcriptional regulator